MRDTPAAMYRYGLIPLVLITICALLPPLCFIEANAIYIARATVQGLAPPQFDDAFWMMLAATVTRGIGVWAAIIGQGLSLAVVACDTFRNGITDRSGARTTRRLFSNFFWCGNYALLINIFNTLLLAGIYRSGISTLIEVADATIIVVPLLLTAAVNLTMFLWAIARSMNASDVLTPRMLFHKVCRSMQLQSVQ